MFQGDRYQCFCGRVKLALLAKQCLLLRIPHCKLKSLFLSMFQIFKQQLKMQCPQHVGILVARKSSVAIYFESVTDKKINIYSPLKKME